MQLSKEIIDKFIAGRCSEAELAEVAAWLQSGETDGLEEAPGNGAAIWRKIEARRRPLWRRFVRRATVAAAAAVLAAAAIYGIRLMRAPQELTAYVAAGQTSRIVLPDSSVVFLQGPAALRYPSRFSEGERMVFLTGTGAFEVSGNARSPFTVVSGKVKTTALGTSFEVRAPEGSEEVKVWLRYGKVVVTRERDSMYLRPGEALGYTGAARTVERAAPEAYRGSVLYFKHAGLDEVITKLENYYNIHIIADTALYNRKWQVTGEFARENPEFVVRNIAFIADVQYRMAGDSLWLLPQPMPQEP